jgi:hypothetical protein
MTAADKWQDADRISDTIVDLLNAELATVSPVEVLAGVMLAMMALLKTAPTQNMPVPLMVAGAAIEECLTTMRDPRSSSSRIRPKPRSGMH